jgi:hypothetical protein
VTASGPQAGETTTAVPATADPIAEARALSNRRYLTSADARRRYELILAVLAVGGRKQSWVAGQLGFSDSNMSRLVRAARRTLTTEVA